MKHRFPFKYSKLNVIFTFGVKTDAKIKKLINKRKSFTKLFSFYLNSSDLRLEVLWTAHAGVSHTGVLLFLKILGPRRIGRHLARVNARSTHPVCSKSFWNFRLRSGFLPSIDNLTQLLIFSLNLVYGV